MPSIPCPHCEADIEIKVNVYGSYIPATLTDPPEHPEYELASPIDCPEACDLSDEELRALGDRAIEAQRREDAELARWNFLDED